MGSIEKTRLEVFHKTLVFPGDHSRFFATDISGDLLTDYKALAKRIFERHLQLTYIREGILQDALSPFRLDYLKSIMADIKGVAVNKDFSPICYFHNLAMWANQWHVGLQKIFNMLAELRLRWLWSGLCIVGGIIIVVFWTGRCKFRTAVAGSILISGATEMVLQVLFLLSFQIMAGFLYRQLALIIAFFMTGLAIGAGWMSRKKPLEIKVDVTRRRFIRVQALVCMLPFGVMLFFQLIRGEIQNLLPAAAIGWFFTVLSLITGILGGVHFALAVMVMAGTGVALEKIGGGFYGLDLAGAATGVLISALFIIPIYGIMNTLILLSMLSVISLLTLLRQPF